MINTIYQHMPTHFLPKRIVAFRVEEYNESLESYLAHPQARPSARNHLGSATENWV